MIELHITMTSKSYSPKDKFRRFNFDTKRFPDIKSAKAWIKENYGKSKQTPMYCDTKDGKAQKIGVVIGFRNSDLSHYPVNYWIQQDWIEFRECRQLIIGD